MVSMKLIFWGLLSCHCMSCAVGSVSVKCDIYGLIWSSCHCFLLLMSIYAAVIEIPLTSTIRSFLCIYVNCRGKKKCNVWCTDKLTICSTVIPNGDSYTTRDIVSWPDIDRMMTLYALGGVWKCNVQVKCLLPTVLMSGCWQHQPSIRMWPEDSIVVWCGKQLVKQ